MNDFYSWWCPQRFFLSLPEPSTGLEHITRLVGEHAFSLRQTRLVRRGLGPLWKIQKKKLKYCKWWHPKKKQFWVATSHLQPRSSIHFKGKWTMRNRNFPSQGTQKREKRESLKDQGYLKLDIGGSH